MTTILFEDIFFDTCFLLVPINDSPLCKKLSFFSLFFNFLAALNILLKVYGDET